MVFSLSKKKVVFISGQAQVSYLLKGVRPSSHNPVGARFTQDISVLLTEYGELGELSSSAQFLAAQDLIHWNQAFTCWKSIVHN